MSALDQLLTKWKLWINRDRTFQADELKELQSHLMEEINYLVKREGLSEEEAFHQAVSLVGEREGLDQEYVKEKSTPGRLVHWVKVNPWSVSATLLILVLISSYFAWYRPIAQENSSLKNDLGYIKTYPGPFKPFEKAFENNVPLLNIPTLEWKKEIKQNYDKEQPFDANLAVSQDGDVYLYEFLSANYISATGKKDWYRKDVQEKYLPVKSGVIVNSWEIEIKKPDNIIKSKKNPTFAFKDFQNHIKWQRDGSAFVMGPDDMIYVFNTDKARLHSYDAVGKERWAFQVPIKNININHRNGFDYFFDQDSNLHLIVSFNDSSMVQYTISPDGDLINQKDVPKEDLELFKMTYFGELIRSDSYNGKIIKENSYSLYHSFSSKGEFVGSIRAAGLDGNQKWVFSESDSGRIISNFSHNFVFSSIYLVYKKYDSKIVYLQSISSIGKLEWEREIISSSSTNPIVDNDGNIYIGAQKQNENKSEETISTIYCFAPDGSVKWTWEDKELINCSFHSDLVFGPNGTLYFVVTDKNNKMYCVKIASSSKK